MRRWLSGLSMASMLAISTSAGSAESHSYTIDPTGSNIVVHVGKTGLLRFAGHEHEIHAPLGRGTLVVDPAHVEASSADLKFDASTLRVAERGEPPEDVQKVQDAMVGPDCLDVRRFPEIRFVSRTISPKELARGGLDVTVRGTLTLHGVSREVTLPLHVVIGDGGLRATGTIAFKQTDFGIKPISVAGVVKVKDEVRIDLTLVAQRAR